LADDEQQIRDLIVTAQRAGFEKNDLDGYMKQWADDAQIIAGRGPEPGEHDTTLDRKQIEATRRVRFETLPKLFSSDPLKLQFEDLKIDVSGGQAVVRATAKVSYGESGEFYEQVKEIYKLRRAPDGWRVYSDRFWLEETKTPDGATRFDAEKWEQFDAEVAAARKSNDPRRLVPALMAAMRFAEAHTIAKQITANDDDDDWHLRGWAALQAGDASDAVRSFQKAKLLEPDAE
jgi:hypothetical protein